MPGFDPRVGKMPWTKEWLTHSSFLACRIPGRRSLLGYRQWGHKELDMTEQLTQRDRQIISEATNDSLGESVSGFVIDKYGHL